MKTRLHQPLLIPAAEFSKARLALLLSQVYVDYFLPVWMDADRFAQMCDFEDVDLSHSIVALIMDEPVGLALFSQRDTRGWISGVGVLPLYRRQGIARLMVESLQSYARTLHLDVLMLEVLVQNTAGLALYDQLGFQRRRDFVVLTLEESNFQPAALPTDISFSEPDRLLKQHAALRRFSPSWQRERVSLMKRMDRLQGLALREDGYLTGYLLYEQQERHQAIYDLAIDPAYGQRVEAARRLLMAVHCLRPGVGGYFVNLPAETELLDAFLQVGYRIWQRQREMVWQVQEATG
jgi:ribosomal protein S18 acetylase RimI-like enzyme